MTYEDICKYVFEQSNIEWEIKDSRKRDRELVDARQISMYLGNWFYPILTWSALSKPFGRDHATAMSAVSHVRDIMFSDKIFRAKVIDYLNYITEQNKIDMEDQVRQFAEDQNKFGKAIDFIDKMEIIAKVYCDIMGKKII
jgi:hypothetical protein